MGIQCGYNEFTGKFYIQGCMFHWEFDTETEMLANKARAWQHHCEKLKAWNITCNMLATYR